MAVFDLEAIIRLNDQGFKRGLSAAGKAIGTFAKAAGTAVAAGAAGVAALATSSVKAYADYEQLAGGVKKLFGNAGMSLTDYANSVGKSTSQAVGSWLKLEQAQSIVLNNAEKAFETAGMSANEYIENVTGISAALVNSYSGNTVKAAEQADKAMLAISDNVNTFGSDISSVQAAYQGFAKQNYTMLDNLKLGYGGTKSEMERLIADANAYREELGLTGDLTIDKYGDVVEAIDLIQQKQGIAGTTAKEAATTISGSLAMTKAAWKNLVRALGDKDADLTKFFDNLVTSAETAFQNILPVAEQAIKGIGQMVTDLAPVIGEKLPGIISSVLPDLVKSGVTLVSAVLTGFATALPDLVAAIPDILTAIKDGFEASWPALKEAGGKLLDMVGEGLKAAGPALLKLGGQIMEKLGPVFSNAWTSIKNTAEKYLPGITSLMSQTWSMISSGAKKAWQGITTVLGDAWSGIRNFWGEHGGQLAEAMSNIWTGISERWQAALDGLSLLWDTWGPTLLAAASGIWDELKSTFELGLNVLSDVFAIFSSVFAGDWSAAWENIKQLGSDLWNGISDALSAHWEIIGQTAKAAWEKIGPFLSQTWQNLKTAASQIFGKIVGAVSDAWTAIKGGVSKAWENIKWAVSDAWEKVKSGVSWDSISSSVDEAWETVKGAVAGAWDGIKAEVSAAWEKVKGVDFGSIAGKVQEAWGKIEGAVGEAWDKVKQAVSDKIEEIKGLVKFDWKLPEIKLPDKLPTITISGIVNWVSGGILGGGTNLTGGGVTGTKPFKWHARAMNTPYLFNDAMIFGAGEAGDEVLYGKASLMDDIRTAVGGTAANQALIDAVNRIDQHLDRLAIYLDSGALVGGIGYDMDRQLGGYSDMGGRELSLA